MATEQPLPQETLERRTQWMRTAKSELEAPPCDRFLQRKLPFFLHDFLLDIYHYHPWILSICLWRPPSVKQQQLPWGRCRDRCEAYHQRRGQGFFFINMVILGIFWGYFGDISTFSDRSRWFVQLSKQDGGNLGILSSRHGDSCSPHWEYCFPEKP